MTLVTRLITYADVGEDGDPRTASVALRQVAILADDRELVVLEGRGWSGRIHGPTALAADPWTYETADQIIETARVVVGPDEPFGGHSADEMETSHWDSIARSLHALGVGATGEELRALPHDVILSERLMRRIPPPAGV